MNGNVAVAYCYAFQKYACLISLMALTAFGCSTMTPHENFKNIMGAKVGRNVNDPDLLKSNVTNPRDLVSTTMLANGNKEMKYRYRGSCRYIFEVADQGTIVAWRFEGSEADCGIVP